MTKILFAICSMLLCSSAFSHPDRGGSEDDCPYKKQQENTSENESE